MYIIYYYIIYILYNNKNLFDGYLAVWKTPNDGLMDDGLMDGGVFASYRETIRFFYWDAYFLTEKLGEHYGSPNSE